MINNEQYKKLLRMLDKKIHELGMVQPLSYSDLDYIFNGILYNKYTLKQLLEKHKEVTDKCKRYINILQIAGCQFEENNTDITLDSLEEAYTNLSTQELVDYYAEANARYI